MTFSAEIMNHACSDMDYILHWSLVVLALGLIKTFIISYDIACQCSRVTLHHAKQSSPSGAGLGDGEAAERGWADTNALGPSTREMGPGTWRDTLDCHFGDYNWRKITDLGSSLLKKMNNTVLNVAEHKGIMVEWEKDPKKPNPFEMIVETPTQKVVRRVMADDETEALKTGKDFSLNSEISPSALITQGLDLEAEHIGALLRFQMKLVWTHSQDHELTRLQLRSNALIRKVEAWYEILQLYIPASVVLRKQGLTEVTVHPYKLSLWLPSEISGRAICDRRLIEIELRKLSPTSSVMSNSESRSET
ncbi:hypothetical protein DFP72DRAFT_854582 [Ephemerocybe angulata]|uniref:Uncharacterized protein n=1 Tax=Ephemerocybe angulata TaxID=980116 RepID=A0A8H6HHR2_9AGAR|nr:hypothetical protein DFP72DRAFT_854582 [Tulosesus angulatus]